MALILIAALIGLAFGSFLNVCIARLPKHLGISRGRSHCTHCNATIRWYDNIPVISYIVLGARCRDCRKRIALQYPLVEILTALLFVYVAWRLPFMTGIAAAQILCGVYLLIGLCVMDWQTYRLPDAFTIPGMLIGFVLQCIRAGQLRYGEYDIIPKHKIHLNSANAGRDVGNVFLTGPEHLVYGRLFAIVGAFLLLFLIGLLYRTLRKREGMGLGDAKLLAMIAAFTGFLPSLLALFIGVFAATLYAIPLLLRRKANATTRLPFGSFLCLGGIFAIFYGDALVGWYRSLL